MAAPELAVLLRTCKHTDIPAIPADTTLAGAIGSTGVTTIQITSVANITADMFIQVDDEIMKIVSVDASATPDEAVVIRGDLNSEGTAPATHLNGATVKISPAYNNFGYALKCDNASISYAKTPIQVPIPQSAPQIIDLGIYRPSVSLSGTVETIGGDPTNTTVGFQGMETVTYTRSTGYGSSNSAKTYYLPYKNVLEDFAATKLHTTTKPLELEWGDANIPTGTNHTGGAVYLVALQQFRVQVDATKEDRYSFSMQFVVGERKDAD